MASDPKLKPCPFCGSKGKYQSYSDSDNWPEKRWSAMCCLGHASSPDFELKEEAAAWWNRRHSNKKRINE